MAKKTNKTNHVLNLLSGAEEQETQDTAMPKEAESKVRIVTPNEEDAVAADVQQLLEEELMQEEMALKEQKEKEQQMEEERAAEEEAEATDETESAADAGVEPEPSAEAEVKETEPEPEAPPYLLVNVMESIVDDKIDYYMDKFNVCRCARCRADVKALALTHLEPKYVVVDTSGISAFLSLYTNKFSSEVLFHLGQACMQVLENPRH